MGRKCVKVAMAYTCVTYTEPFVEKISSPTVLESHMPHHVLWKYRKKYRRRNRELEICPLAWRQRTKRYAGSTQVQTPRRHFVPYMLSVLHVDYARARFNSNIIVSFPVARPTLQGRGIKHQAGADSTVYCFLAEPHATIYYSARLMRY